MPSFCSWLMTLEAWLDSVDRFSWYWMLSVIGWPAAAASWTAVCAADWYQGSLGAMIATLRGLPCRLPPA